MGKTSASTIYLVMNRSLSCMLKSMRKLKEKKYNEVEQISIINFPYVYAFITLKSTKSEYVLVHKWKG